jgi:hypothetical protein
MSRHRIAKCLAALTTSSRRYVTLFVANASGNVAVKPLPGVVATLVDVDDELALS